MKGQMRQGLFCFLVPQTEECGLHLMCGDTGLNRHSCDFKLLVNCSAEKYTYFLAVICSLGVIIYRGTKKRGHVYMLGIQAYMHSWVFKVKCGHFYQCSLCLYGTHLNLFVNCVQRELQHFSDSQKSFSFF